VGVRDVHNWELQFRVPGGNGLGEMVHDDLSRLETTTQEGLTVRLGGGKRVVKTYQSNKEKGKNLGGQRIASNLMRRLMGNESCRLAEGGKVRE